MPRLKRPNWSTPSDRRPTHCRMTGSTAGPPGVASTTGSVRISPTRSSRSWSNRDPATVNSPAKFISESRRSIPTRTEPLDFAVWTGGAASVPLS